MQKEKRLIVAQIIILGMVAFALVGYGSQDTQKSGFEEIEITGLFSVGGKPMVSLSIRNSSSFTLRPGQRSRGIKLLQVQGDNDPYVVLERNGLQGRVFLNKSRPSTVIREVLYEDLEERERVKYVKGETEPFTGTMIRYCKLVPGGIEFIRPTIDKDEGWKRLQTPYVDGRANGMHITYRKDGSKYREVPYVNGKTEGKAIEYREDGSKLYDQEYMKGKMDGMLVVYREDGSKKYEVRRVHYKKVGTEVWFSEDGSVSKEVVYEKGKKITETEY